MQVLDISENFLALPAGLSSFETAPVVIQSIPYEHTSSYLQGSAKGPEAILAASHFVEFYDEELGSETISEIGGIATLPAMEIGNKTDAEAMEFIAAQTLPLLEAGKFVVTLGAEHTITFGVLKAFVERFGNKFSILQIDAHSDLRESYHDNRFSHASVMARCLELGVSLTQVGIRAQCKEEAEVCKNHPQVTTIYAHEMDKKGEWLKRVMDSLHPHVYITINADGFDPSVMSSVGTAEPGGLSWKQGTRLLQKVCAKRKILGFDIVELLPAPHSQLTEYTCAKLLYKVLGYIGKPHTKS
jgi:agmatinase